jgi:hypothetical protein
MQFRLDCRIILARGLCGCSGAGRASKRTSNLERLGATILRKRRIDDRLVPEMPLDDAVTPIQRLLFGIDVIRVVERGSEFVAADDILYFGPAPLWLLFLPKIEKRAADAVEIGRAIQDVVASRLENGRCNTARVNLGVRSVPSAGYSLSSASI